eukprot:CAMPEP_0113619028 /NCGR_PEP_ID=MMETSP0017_2-20120614/9654_1 /TAXON_ID=2856 /ORGANISM="Cylindrotheca closterium" /LENGTH=656 /DNA_ID=CAMNT_0000528581 /DNA_START=36 /DNA_END=2006 /DNA_ORIENTATION=- /assembly_acc=CAM_ASM_000147
MIPAGDHSSRSLLLRRVSSYSEVTASQHQRSDSSGDEYTNNNLDGEEDHLIEPSLRLGTAAEDEQLLNSSSELRITPSIVEDEGGGDHADDDDDDCNHDANDGRRTTSSRQPQHHNSNHILSLYPFFPALEYEPVSMDDDDSTVFSASLLQLSERSKKEWKLWLVFLLLVLSGVGNVVLAKLQSLPMYNYPTFLNVYANFVYIIMSSVCYILPAIHFGWFSHSISWRHLSMNKKPFLVMGFLDAMAAAMQVLSTIYLPGTLLVLLPQVAIPFSMITSRLVLRESFTWHQITGAAIVLGGIVVVLMPVLTHHRAPSYSCQPIMGDEEEFCSVCEMEVSEMGCRSHVKNEFGDHMVVLSNETRADTVSLFCEWVSKEESISHDDSLEFVWSLVMLASCIPMVFSTVYKQVALQVEMDPILVNCFVATFQLLFGIPLAIPAGVSSSPQVTPWDLPENWRSASKCLFLQANTIESGCHPDDCSKAALFVHLGLLSSAVYTISMMLVLKYGSASLLYLGLTLVVPLGHLIFSIHSPEMVHVSDVLGLVILLAGLVLYRFGHRNDDSRSNSSSNGNDPDDEIMAAGAYRRLVEDDDDDDEEPRHIDDPTISLVDDDTRNHQQGLPPPTEEVETPHGHVRNNTGGSEGFLEFLREPFLMVGDI